MIWTLYVVRMYSIRITKGDWCFIIFFTESNNSFRPFFVIRRKTVIAVIIIKLSILSAWGTYFLLRWCAGRCDAGAFPSAAVSGGNKFCHTRRKNTQSSQKMRYLSWVCGLFSWPQGAKSSSCLSWHKRARARRRTLQRVKCRADHFFCHEKVESVVRGVAWRGVVLCVVQSEVSPLSTRVSLKVAWYFRYFNQTAIHPSTLLHIEWRESAVTVFF